MEALLCVRARAEELTLLPVPGEARRFGAWLPPSVCASARGARSAPIVLALGCYGCSMDTVARPLFNAAERFGLVLVAPEQHKRSWNAGECCGAALRERTPDAAFIRAVIAHVRGALGTPRAGAAGVYAFGWSNGGFMATELARAGAPLDGLAVVAGYSSTHLHAARPGGELNATLPAPTPILLFHARDDAIVRAEGCCAAGRGCCCGIAAPRCVGVEGAWGAWALANRCSPAPSPVAAEPADAAAALGVRCVGRAACAAATVVCVAQRGGHSFGSGFERFAFGGMVGAFFARAACARTGGAWDARREACQCGGAGGPGAGPGNAPARSARFAFDLAQTSASYC
ncbi:hypothetical protein KFE25_002572 [Diacronema lutheri]|uniref:Uncharacterized protein n=1 Tax=Diacronema lutheri TaxID=2081491 RepID=A0A8J5XTQ4_DIALT|nr:hypothetical protein KFE25_002572 [Diacronema lutheri]